MYVVNAACDVLLNGSSRAQLRPDVVDLIRARSAVPRDGAEPIALADGQIVRLVPLHGGRDPHFAVFIEQVASRAPIALAAQRFGLTSREADVLAELVRGVGNEAISALLGICETTVITHVRNIGEKMAVSKRKEIVSAVLAIAEAASS